MTPTLAPDFLPPMDLSAEHAVLGAVLQPDAGDSLAQLVDRLEPG